MILDTKVSIKVVAANKKYYEDKLNVSLSINNYILVDINDLPKKSSILIQCKCNTCNRLFRQRIYRDHDTCGYCKSVNRMTGNTLRKKTQDIPDKNYLQSLVSEGKGKQEIARLLNTTISILNRWLKHHEICMIPYVGIKAIKNKETENNIITKIMELSEPETVPDISKKFNINRSVTKTLLKNNPHLLHNIKSNFSVWEQSRKDLTDKLPFFIEENKTKTLKIIADENQISIEQLKRCFYENKIDVKLHSYNKSRGELEIKEFINNLDVSCHSYRFFKKYEIDCYVQTKKFGVEYCGEYWHRYDPYKNNKKYHLEKHVFFKNQDITLFTIFESEWKNKRSIIESMIKYRVKHDSIIKIPARNCIVKEISKQDANNFHKNNHINGFTSSSFNFGLFYNDKIVSVLSIVKSRFDKDADYEISRFSSLLNTSIAGGFSKLFKFFIKIYNPASCVTYSDRRFGEGKTYENSDFTFVKSTNPNYWYFDKRGEVLESRMKYQKNKLKKLFPDIFDDSKTEFEIMSDAGYYKLFDCGSNKYLWRQKETPCEHGVS